MRITALGVASLLAACGTDVGQEPGPDAAPVEKTTWYQDVAPIVSEHCMSCHQDGGIAPFALTDYAGAHDNASRMLTQIDKGAMPPFDAREEADCTPRFTWKDDPRLSAAEIATIHKWVADGSLEGTQTQITIPPKGSQLSGITKTITPAIPFTATGDKDQFICYVLDPAVGAGAWLTGLQVRPSNDLVVHHAVVAEIPPGTDQDALVAAHPVGQPFVCDQTATPAGAFTIAIWTPGNQPMETPADLAVPVVGGAKFIVNIHYHPTGGTYAPDATSYDLRLTQAWPKKMYFVGAFGNAFQAPQLLAGPGDSGGPQFKIPANVADHPEHMRFTVPDFGPSLKNLQLYSANPHMHLIGTHINSHIERPAARGNDPQTECLANGGWNFDWQRTYIYNTTLDKLPTVQAGDVLDIKCTWNNTIDNPFVQRLLHDQHLSAPYDVTLGEESTDEMCLEIFGLSIDAPPAPSGRTTPTVDDLPMAAMMKMAEFARSPQ
jgi:hypothetical protein